MWGKLLKFPAHPPYKPIRSTHEQRSETGASKRTKISCGSRSGVVRGRQGSSGVVGGRRGRRGSSGVVRGRQGSSGVVRSRRGRQGSSGSSGVVSRFWIEVVRDRQLKLDNCCCHLCGFLSDAHISHFVGFYINPIQQWWCHTSYPPNPPELSARSRRCPKTGLGVKKHH